MFKTSLKYLINVPNNIVVITVLPFVISKSCHNYNGVQSDLNNLVFNKSDKNDGDLKLKKKKTNK